MNEKYMRRAIALAEKGIGWTSPNPLVGAVIVKDGRIIGEGYHERYGELHAERNALKNVTEDPKGATMYVTLEPCCHHGKQPPCTDAIIESGIAEVVIGSRDPNPLVSGKGEKILLDNGIKVTKDFLRDECDELNPVFFHYITTGRPYVVMKYAMTMDGKIATRTGASKWITGKEAREAVHMMRHQYSAVMAGIGTVLADDPTLNCRIEGLTSPIRVICDSSLRIPLHSNILKTADTYETIIFCASENEKADEIRKTGAEVVACGKDGRVDLNQVIDILGERGIDSVLLEGGGTLNEEALKCGIVNEVNVFIAPKVFGGKDAKSPVEGIGIEDVDDAFKFRIKEVKNIGEDLWIKYVYRNS